MNTTSSKYRPIQIFGQKFKLLIAAVMMLSGAPAAIAATGDAGNGNSGVKVEKISFTNGIGIKIVGNLRYPEGFDRTKKYSAVIALPPAGGVKEQTAGLYAGKLAAKGFITLAIDSSYQGESGGEPRFREDPIARVEDVRGAVDYLVTLPFVDEKRIGVLGICAGGGYAASAAMTERRIRAVGVVVPVNAGRESRAAGTQATIQALDAISADRTAQARSGKPMIVPWIPDEYKNSDDIDLREAWQYYRTPRGQNANWHNEMRFTGMDAVTAFDAFHLSETLLTQPLEIIVGTKQGAFGSVNDGHDLFKRAASAHKDITVMDGASHFDMYDNLKYVDKAVDKLSSFYQQYLNAH